MKGNLCSLGAAASLPARPRDLPGNGQRLATLKSFTHQPARPRTFTEMVKGELR